LVQSEHQHTRIILASNSPRRKELLALTGWQYEIIPADVDETPHNGEAADRYVWRLAQEKANAVAGPLSAQVDNTSIVVAADTTVADRGEILGKPQDDAEAEAMLKTLRGRTHQVYTAVSVVDTRTGQTITELAATDVPMRPYTQAEIDAYIASRDPFDKAGGYAIQHPEFRPVEHLTGCYANVVGLPLCHLERACKKLGLQTSNDIPAACQRMLQYDCTVYPQVQKGEL
jgi:MAF protein